MRKKKKKKRPNSQPKKKGKKKVKSGQKLWLGTVCGSLCMFNYNIAIELWVMETENSQNVFSISITQKSENWKIETELLFAKQPFYHGSHHFWVMNYGNWKLSYENY